MKDRLGHDRRYAVDWSKIRTELGWTPAHNFDEWLEETINWYRTNEEWWRDVKNGVYKQYTKPNMEAYEDNWNRIVRTYRISYLRAS